MIEQVVNESALMAHFRQAVAEDLKTLALLQNQETSKAALEKLREIDFPYNLGLQLQTQAGKDACDFMHKALSILPEQIDEKTLDDLAVDYAAIYLNSSLHASPYESVWLSDDGLVQQEPMFQVREWYVKYGLVAKNWRRCPDDHLSLQLEFIAHLLCLDEQEETLKQVAIFLDEHLLRWTEQFAARVANRCATAYYGGLVILMAQYLDELRNLLAELLSESRPSMEEIEKRMVAKKKPESVEIKWMPEAGPPGW
jgi:TorA maturation chaperone TorD